MKSNKLKMNEQTDHNSVGATDEFLLSMTTTNAHAVTFDIVC